MKRARLLLILSGASLLAFVALLFAVLFVDVRAIGPLDSSIGLSSFNGAFRDLVGYSEVWYQISEYTIYVAMLTAAFFVGLGVYQLIRRRSLWRVDIDIHLLGAVYAAVIAVYVLFELFAANFRPVLTDGALEPSFPSTHTTVVLTVMFTAAEQAWRRIRGRAPRFILTALPMLLASLTLLARALSGVHWLTDVIGGVLFSAFAVFAYLGFVHLLRLSE